MATRNRLRIAGRDARVTLLASGILTSLSKFADSSAVVGHIETVFGALRSTWNGSVSERGTSRGIGRIQRYIRGSQTVSHLRPIVNTIAGGATHAVDRATVTGLARRTEQTIKASWLYRWLTAEPEPEVIVIDLRETFSIGPIIEIIDYSIRLIVPASHRSTVVTAAEAIHDVVTDAPLRAASLVFGVALLTNIGVTLAVGVPTQGGLIASIVLLAIAALGTRLSMSWAELVETQPAQLFIAALEPPELPEEFEERK